MESFVTDNDLAERYKVSRVTVWRWARQGRLPAPIKLAPATTRWRLSEIEKWETERAQEVA